MRSTAGLLLILLVGMLNGGCEKDTVMVGTVVDGQKRPISGAVVIAKMAQPIKGYEQSVATTDSRGAFRLQNLFPVSEYRLAASKGRSANFPDVTAKSGRKGETILVSEPIEIRFMLSGDGTTASDTRTGLMWTRDADILQQRIDLDQAKQWVAGLDIGGYRDWRVPTRDELAGLAKSGGETPAESLNGGVFFNVEHGSYWTTTTHENNPEYAWWVVEMNRGGEFNLNKSDRSYVWPVRTGNPQMVPSQ
jgi:hypothetical protein